MLMPDQSYRARILAWRLVAERCVRIFPLAHLPHTPLMPDFWQQGQLPRRRHVECEVRDTAPPAGVTD